MIEFSNEDNKEAMIKAFELFGLCMAAGPCNDCVFFDGSLPEDPCSIGCPNSWPLFDTSTDHGAKNRTFVLNALKNRNLVINVLRRKGNNYGECEEM